MAATGTPTPNIGLRIPQGTDPASVDDINYNSNLLDTKLGAVGNTSVQDQIDSLNSKIDNLDSGDVTSLCTINTTNCSNASVYKYGNIIIITGGTKSGVTGTNLTLVTVPYTLRRAYCYIGSYNTKVVGEGIIGAGSHDLKANISKSTDVGYFNIVTEIVPS